MKYGMRFLLVLVVISAVACGENTPGPNVRDLTEIEQSLVQSSNRFGFKLLSEVVGQSDGWSWRVFSTWISSWASPGRSRRPRITSSVA